MTLSTFFQIQLDRILLKPTIHATGPKKPTLAQQDVELKK
jgi:hypothetical protein